MILKGSQRAGAGHLAAHLLNERDNDHVRVVDLRGFVADELHEAFEEARAISLGTRCKQYLFSLSLNPPKGQDASEEDFGRAVDEAERVLGLQDQPRAIVFHEKEGRRHAHVVWSRIEASTMRAINLPFFKRKLTALSRELFLEHGWTLPEGLRTNGGRSPLNFTLAEWQQAKRLGSDPREIKDAFRDAWARSDSLPALRNALEERGYFLARGDRRAIVALNVEGEVFSLSRWAGVKAKDLRQKCGDGSTLPGVDETRRDLATRITAKLKDFSAELRTRQKQETERPREVLRELCARQTRERQALHRKLEERWNEETRKRTQRLRTGLAALWDNLTGRAASIRRYNEREAMRGLRRDSRQRDALVIDHMAERDPVQRTLDSLRLRHAQERKLLAREIAQHLRRRRAFPGEREPETGPPLARRRHPLSPSL